MEKIIILEDIGKEDFELVKLIELLKKDYGHHIITLDSQLNKDNFNQIIDDIKESLEPVQFVPPKLDKYSAFLKNHAEKKKDYSIKPKNSRYLGNNNSARDYMNKQSFRKGK